MAGRVIQGFFAGGRMHPMPGLAPAGPVQRAAVRAGTPGPPQTAFKQAGQPVQRNGGDDNFEVDPIRLGLARGGGKPLPLPVLAKMEAAFGADFSAVRVHVGPQAARIGAIAFTTGNDIYFAPGRYQPDSVQGQQLLGHELAHVVQQREGRVRMPAGGVSVVQDQVLEAEADRLGARAAMHRTAPVQAKMAGGSAGVHIASPNGVGARSQRIAAGAMGSLMVHTKRGPAAEVTDLSVGTHFRDQGIGRDLLRSAARAGLRAGNSRLSLSAQDNGSGRLTRWYKEMGFQQIGVNGRGFPLLEAPITRVLGNSVQRRVAGAVQGPGAAPPMRRAGTPAPIIQRSAPKFDVVSFNAQGISEGSSAVKQDQVRTVLSTAQFGFITEANASFVPPPGYQLMNSKGKAEPAAKLNYVVPDGSTLYKPTTPGAVAAGLKEAGRPITYERLGKGHARYPVLISDASSDVAIYAIHAKSRPNSDQQYALACLILSLQDDLGASSWILIGDLNLEPEKLQERVTQIIHSAHEQDASYKPEKLFWSNLGQSTHSGGKELDFAVGNVDIDKIQKVGKSNLRGGSDHDGVALTFAK